MNPSASVPSAGLVIWSVITPDCLSFTDGFCAGVPLPSEDASAITEKPALAVPHVETTDIRCTPSERLLINVGDKVTIVLPDRTV